MVKCKFGHRKCTGEAEIKNIHDVDMCKVCHQIWMIAIETDHNDVHRIAYTTRKHPFEYMTDDEMFEYVLGEIMPNNDKFKDDNV